MVFSWRQCVGTGGNPKSNSCMHLSMLTKVNAHKLSLVPFACLLNTPFIDFLLQISVHKYMSNEWLYAFQQYLYSEAQIGMQVDLVYSYVLMCGSGSLAQVVLETY